MFQNTTTNNVVRYHTPFTATTTWQWPPASRASQAQTPFSLQTTTGLHTSSQHSRVVAETSRAEVATTNLLVTSINIAYVQELATVLGHNFQPSAPSQLCTDTSTSTSIADICHSDISPTSTLGAVNTATAYTTSTLSGISTLYHHTLSPDLQTSTETSFFSESVRFPSVSSPTTTSLPEPNSVHVIATTVSRPGLFSQLQSTLASPESTSTTTNYHLAASATPSNFPGHVSTHSSSVSSSVVIAAIALGSVGAVLLFALLVQLVRCCCAKRRRLSPAEQELRAAQETTLHPLSAHARFSLVTLPVLPQWQTKLGSPLIAATMLFGDCGAQHGPKLGLPAHPKQAAAITEPSQSKEREIHASDLSSLKQPFGSAYNAEAKELGLPLSSCPVFSQLHDCAQGAQAKELGLLICDLSAPSNIIPPKGDAEPKVRADLLMPPAIPSPWSWVSSQTSATSPSRFSFDSRGQRRRSDPFDLEGKGFDFNC